LVAAVDVYAIGQELAWQRRKSVQFGECGDMNDVVAAVLASPNVIGAMQCDVTGNAMRRFTGEAQNDKFLRYVRLERLVLIGGLVRAMEAAVCYNSAEGTVLSQRRSADNQSQRRVDMLGRGIGWFPSIAHSHGRVFLPSAS
jgi:hypothetical protein